MLMEEVTRRGQAQPRPAPEALHVPLMTADARVKRSGIARCKVEVFDTRA
jgi:hypothetical protein